MGLFDNLKKTITDTAGEVMKQAQNITDQVKDIRSIEDLQKKGEEALEGIKNINVSESLKDLQKKGGEAINGIVSTSQEAVKNVQSAFAKKEEPNEMITSEDALKIFYYVMAADGRLDGTEMTKFEEIGKELNPNYEEAKDELLRECSEKISKESDPDYYVDNITECISQAVGHSHSLSEGEIPAKLLLWNLLVICFADSEYSDAEKRVLRSILRLLDIDKAVLAEMESTIHTLTALEEEEEWLRSTNRPYAEVEKHMNEISNRREAIMQGVHALMLD